MRGSWAECPAAAAPISSYNHIRRPYQRDNPMISKRALFAIGLAAALAVGSFPAAAKDKVKVAFIGPITSGVAANGIGGRNSAELAVKLRNADAKAKYEYELLVLDDECKPNTAVQVATKAGAARSVIGSVSHYCSVAAIAAVETYNRLGLPMVVSRKV